MSFPRYESYKPSGVEWVDELPSHWGATMPLYRVARERDERNEGMAEDNLLSLSYGRIVEKDITSNDGLLPASFETYQIVHEGDMVLRLTDLQNDKRSLRSGIVTKQGIITSAYLALEPTRIAPQFFAYLLRAYDLTKVFYSMGGGLRQSMKFDDLKRLPILLPSEEEQEAIASFLDRETTKIDALVEEQNRLTELLKEKRQAVITHAVTKGLDPDTPMKDSGVEWIGQVPKEWQVVLLKRVFSSVEYGISDTLEPDGQIAVLRMGNINSGRVLLDDLKYVAEVDPSLLLRDNDLLFNRTNSLDLIGKVGLLTKRDKLPITFASYLVRLRLNNDAEPKYFGYLLNTPGILGVARSSAFVAIGQCNLNPTRYGQIRVAIPPAHEQLSIVEYLDNVVGAMDELISNCERTIVLLGERRSALISAAVTGKIDVRERVPKEAEAA